MRLIGVNRSGSEYACSGDDGSGGHGYGFFQGPVNNRAIKAMRKFDYTKHIKNSKDDLERLAASFSIVIGGFGDTDCNSDFSRRLMTFADGLGISYLAWTWNTVADYGGCENALLGPKRSAYYSGHPSGFGRGVRKHFLRVQGLSS